MERLLTFAWLTVLVGLCQGAFAEVAQKIVDIPARPGVTQRPAKSIHIALTKGGEK